MMQEKLRCTKEPYIEDVGPRKIKSIRFSTFSGEDIRKLAEVQVWNNRIYDLNLKPIENGLLDPRMGAPNRQTECATCHGNFTDCPGHFGYLKLILPVFNVGYFNSILNILKCICKGCGRILLDETLRKTYLKKMRNPKADILQKNALMKIIRDKCKPCRCLRCGYANGVVKKARSGLYFIQDFSKTADPSVEEFRSALSHTKDKTSFQVSHVLSAVAVLSLFRKMLDEDCELLNLYDRPEKLIVTHIAVPPVSIRPSVIVDSGRSSNEDNITSILKNIINTNSILREDLEGAAPPFKCLDCWTHLQIQVVEYINSEAPCIPDSKHRGLVQRLKGKQGRFRGNLSGKRVEFTGRTVISPDPNLKITEVAIPILMARVLTYPERVSNYNIEKLRQLVRNGPSKYPGANFVLRPDGSKVHLKYVDKRDIANELKYGYVVERHLEDGDIVLFNRQPSLHRMSIMCHRARIMPWRTLRFNESVCNPYNADFDGDEMNLHVPQTEEARTEALMLMGVQNNLCTPKNGEILVASTQDFLTSSFLVTRKDTFYDRASFSLMCSYIGDAMDPIDLPTPALIKPIELWTGKQLFSVLIRPNANTRVFLNLIVKEKIYSKSETMCPSDGYVYFRNSELMCGQLGKATLGNGNKDGLFSVLLRDYNPHAAASCMNRLAKLSARWIGNHGFSIGIDDVQPGENLNQQKRKKINEGYRECHELISSYSKGQLTLQSGCNAAQTLELKITGVLNQIRSTAGNVCMNELHWRNSPLIMSQCGSKGSPINISQMVACVGQQSVGGRRAPNGFIDRTLPHFPISSKTPAAKGFVANSFYTGLTPTEFFFHTMGGREGLVDTAVKTAETGYMSRRLMKGLEDLSIYYDQTVRTANGSIVQFVYGDDGMDPAKMEGKDGIPLNLDQLFMKVMATCPLREQDTLSPAEILHTLDDRLSKYDTTPEGGCSAAFKKMLSDFLHKHAAAFSNIRRALQLDENHVQKKDSSVLESVAANISGISAKQLQVFLETCIFRYHSKKIEAGAAIGAIGAQSIGEPGTQMTLKTFHFAGVASMNVTLGVPRIKEIINAAKNISTPIITATLVSDRDVISARMVKSSLEKTVLGEVAKAIKIVLKSSQPYIAVKLDMERIEALHIRISSQSVQQAILNHPKIKLKPEHIRVLGNNNLKIYPPEADRSKLQFELHSLKAVLPKVIVKGIATVERAVINNTNGVYNLLVEGTNLLAVIGTPGINGSKTKSNHVIEVQQTLGIEAARQCIINEIQYTMRNHGMSIDARHMMLLADLMTYRGEVLGITRFGISKMKDSVLMLASFEKTAEHLFNASYNGRNDQIEGVSECIIMGIPMQLGTGILKVRQRVEQLPELTYRPDPIIC
ncbi:DNA-directed RNA polymerase III subunit 1 isoform X1 [Phoenix dactylifera]|uniref:DNA-directed RNA polymerase subunit n=1 Tax=Phoenix dactylifera TaxID=42345 RepID=A0A8B8ZHV0_PHODC|nr:DNA-directed RNA polymerase III subunit 1 isoform X1 [Phoenix dactylifera]XP_038972863.1 DNA-directed RNA polymerase III subunit 1 isoform X1 [Phoenix dactylifera]